MEFLTSRDKLIILILLLTLPLTQAEVCSQNCLSCDSDKLCLLCEGDYKIMDGICLESCPFNSFVDPETSQCTTPTGAASRFTMNSLTGSVVDSISGDIVLITGTDQFSFYPTADEADPYPSYLRGYYFQNSYLQADLAKPLLSPYFLISITFRPNLGNGPILVKTKPGGEDILYLYMESNEVKVNITVYDNVQRDQVEITHSCPSDGLVMNAWNRLTFQFSNISSPIELICKIGNVTSTESFNDRRYEFYDYSNGSLQIGAYGTSYFNGSIYEISTYYGVSENLIYDLEYTSDCNDCANCPISLSPMCLSPCEYNTDTHCDPCPGDCSRGVCRSATSCSLCYESKCDSCDNYEQGSCRSCSDNYQLVNKLCECGVGFYDDASTGVCEACISMCKTCTGPTVQDCIECNIGYYLDESAQKCSACKEICQTCSGPQSNECLSCYTGYYLYSNTCASEYPLSYNSASKKKLYPLVPFASWNFDGIENSVLDSINNLTADCGSTSSFYPNYDTNDPRAVIKRGYYFDGVDDIININPAQSAQFKTSYAVALWFRPESLQTDGHALLSKLDASLAPIWEVQISAYGFGVRSKVENNPYYPSVQHTFGLSLGEWYHLVISWGYANPTTTISFYLNGSQVSNFTMESTIFIDNSAYFSIGCKPTQPQPTECFNGYIFSISLYDTHLESDQVSYLISYSCSQGSCTVCPPENGICLSKCSRLDGVDESGNCIECLDRCSDGCRDGNRCSLCKDHECSKCIDYEDTQCQECISNAVLSSGDCKCLNSIYRVEEESCVTNCPIGCINCNGPEDWICTECDSAESLYLFLGSCLSYCPLGYVPNENIPRTCQETDNKLASFTFDKIQGVVQDTQGVFEFTTGTSSNFYPYYDPTDPYAAYNRGYYFDGRTSYMKLTSNPILFAKSFSISLWLRPESSKLQTLLSKEAYGWSPFSISLDNLSPRIDFIKNTGSTQEAISHKFDRTLVVNAWNFIVFAINYQNSTSELICYINSEKSSNTIGSGSYLDSSDYSLYLGFNSTISDHFQGFIYNLNIFNYYLDNLDGLFTTSCDGLCDICPSGTCLSDCGLYEYEEEGVCARCLECDFGCRYGNHCGLCSDSICEVCSDYVADSCTKCFDLASLDSNNRCVCPAGYYWSQTESSCKVCSSICESCTNFGAENCILCSQGYFKTPEKLCLQECPIGYTSNVDDRACIQDTTPGLIISVTFDSFSPNKSDSVSGFKLGYGSTSSYFPSYDDNDPICVPNSGLYISSNKYATILPKDKGFSLGNSFTMKLWVKAKTQDAEEVILQKVNQDSGEYSFSLSITKYDSFIAKFLLSSTVTDEAEYYTLEIDQFKRFLQASSSWNRITTIFYSDGSNTVAQLILNTNLEITRSIPNTIFKDSIDKLIQFGNRNPTSTFKGFIQNFRMYNINMTHDQANADFPSSCNCSACTEDGCISPCDFNQVEVDGSCKDCLSSSKLAWTSCKYGCLRTSDCHLNEDILCETYSWYRASDCISCIPNAVKTDAGCKCVENSTFNPLERRCECNHNYWLNGEKCELCVRWVKSDEVSAYFDDNYRSVIYEFSQPVNLENVDCRSIFSSESTSKFGIGYTCKIENETKLSVSLGAGATLVDEKTVILEGKLKSMESGCNNHSSILDITVSYIHPKPSPTALFDRIDNHYIECGDLAISGSRSEGTLGRSLNYKWTIETDPAIPSLDKYSTSDFSSQDTLSIANEDLEPASLTITLTVRNFLNMMDSITHTTKLVPGKGIPVLFDPAVYYDFYRGDYTTYSPRPVGQCEISNSLEFSWSYQGISNNLTAFDVDFLMSSQKTNRMFVVPPNILPAGSIVTFRADINDTESGAGGYGELDITIKLSEPIIITDRADGDIGVNQPLNVNAGSSFDPDDLSDLEYEWSCGYLDRNCSEIISNPNSEMLQIPPGTMKPDTQYEFTLEVLKSVQSKLLISQKVLIYNTKIYPVPDANIIIENHDSSYSTSFSTLSELQLKIVLNDDERFYTIQWSKVQGGSIRFLTPDNGLHLVIAGDSMDPGTLYTIEVSLQDDEHTYRYYLDIYTNSPPMNGKLTSNPSKGEEFSTIFKLEASNWVDIENDYPIQYGFGYAVLGEDKTLNSKNSTNIYYTQLPFCTENLFVYAFDSLGSYNRADLQIEVQYQESLSTEEILEIYAQRLKDPRTDPLEMLGISNFLAVGGISRDFYYTGVYPNKTQEEIEIIYDAFNLAIEALQTLLSSSDYFSIQALHGSVSVLNSLTDSPYFKNDTDSRLTLIDMLTNTIDLAYRNDVVEDELIETAVGTNDQIINFDSEDMYEYPGNMVDVISAYDHILGSKAITMVPGQTLEGESENTKYGVTVQEIDGLNGFTFGLNNSITEILLPSNMSEDVKKLYPDIQEVGMLIIEIDIKSMNASRADPSIVLFSMFDAKKEVPESLDVTLSEYFIMKIPLRNVPEVWDPTCGFLNETLKLWDARGCKLVSYNDEYGVCSCNHFTAFSLDEGLDQAGATLDNSNIDMTVNIDAFNDIDWSGNAIGLYFCMGILFIYVVIGILLCVMDFKDDKKSQLERANSKAQALESVKTPNIDNIMIFEEVKSDDEKKSSNKKVDLLSKERSTDRDAQMSQSDQVYELRPEDIELLTKIENEASPKNIKKSWWNRYKEEHCMLNLFLHNDPEIKRFARLTLVVVEFMGSMFFIGMFYDSDGKTEEAEEEKTFMETMKEYSWNDFWIMIYSTVIMAVAMIILGKLFTITPITVETAPDLEKKIRRKNMIKMILGYIIAFGLLGYFVWSIILFSIQFNINASNMWIFSTSLSFVWETIIGQTYKLAIKTLIIVSITTLKARRYQKKLEQGEFEFKDCKKESIQRRKTRAETDIKLEPNEESKSSTKKPHSSSSESKEKPKERSEGSGPDILAELPIVIAPIDDDLPRSKRKRKSRIERSS